LAFNIDSLYRKPFFHNISFVIILVLLGIATAYLILIPTEVLRELFNLFELPFDFRFLLLGLAACLTLLVLLYERYVVPGMMKLRRRCFK
jgi:hypothetical protein